MASSTFTEDSFLRPIFENPDDLRLREVYADLLEKRGDPRGEYLRLLLKQGRNHHRRWAGGMGAKHGSFMSGITDWLDKLRPGLDASWVTIFDDFACRVAATRTVQLRIPTSPAAEHGVNVFSADYHAGALLVISGGWEHVGTERMTYRYVRPPPDQPGKDPVIAVEIPTDAELERLALHFHKQGKSEVENFGPWTVQYQSSRSQYTGGPSMFIFGVCAPWKVELSWDDGDDKPPRWIRHEGDIA